MGYGVSLFMLAVGAILAFAVDVNTNDSGVNLDTVGVILMVIGAVGLLMTMFVWDSWRGRRDTVVGDGRGVIREREREVL